MKEGGLVAQAVRSPAQVSVLSRQKKIPGIKVRKGVNMCTFT